MGVWQAALQQIVPVTCRAVTSCYDDVCCAVAFIDEEEAVGPRSSLW